MRCRTEMSRLTQFLLILLLSQISHGLERKLNHEVNRNQPRFLNSQNISNTTTSLARTVNEFFIGILETGGLIPSVLKGSTFTNSIYGFVNRTGLLVAGAGLVGISGYYFLRDAQALPRMDTVIDSALRIPNIFSNFMTKFYRPFLRSRYDVINLVEFEEEDIYDQDLRQKYRRLRPRRRRPGNQRVRQQYSSPRLRPVKSDPQDGFVPDVVLIDQYFDHPNRDKIVRFRRPQRRPLIPELLKKPLEILLDARKRRRRRQFRGAKPRIRNFQDQNQVPLSFGEKLEKVFIDIKDLFSF